MQLPLSSRRHLIPPLQLPPAHRAVERLLVAAAAAHDDLPVGEDGQRVDEGLVQPEVVEVEQLLQLPLQRRVRPADDAGPLGHCRGGAASS